MTVIVKFFHALIYETSPWKTWEMAFLSPWKKTFSQTLREARDPPSCAYLNGKTTLRPCIQDIFSLINSIVSRPVRATTRTGR